MGLISLVQNSAIYIVIIGFIAYGAYTALPYILDSIDQIKDRRKKNQSKRGDGFHGTDDSCDKARDN